MRATVPELIEMLHSENTATQLQGAEGLGRLGAGDAPPRSAAVPATLPPPSDYTDSDDDEGPSAPWEQRAMQEAVQRRAMSAALKAQVHESGGVSSLIELLSEYSPLECREAAARALGNLVVSANNLKVAVADGGGVPLLVSLLTAGCPRGTVAASRTLGNLAAGGDDLRVAITVAGGIPPLVGVLTTGNPRGQECAARALGNLAGGSAETTAGGGDRASE